MSQTEATPSLSTEEFLSGKVAVVDVPGIERELRSLWTDAMHAPSESGQPTVLRACSLNLILYSQDLNSEASAGNVLDEIAVQHPCRALLAISLATEKPNIEAWVSARCHLTAGSSVMPSVKQICCEQITVRSEGPGVHKLSSAVLPLLVPDLPVFLYWRTKSIDQRQLETFRASTDKLMVDTALLAPDLSCFGQLSSQIANYRNQPIVSDLNWRRLLSWRRAIAQVFSDGQLNTSDLNAIVKVKVSHYDGLIQALLFAGWLSSCLGWTASSIRKNGKSLFFQFEGARGTELAELELESEVENLVPMGNIANVQISMANNCRLSVSFEQNGHAPALVAEIKTADNKTQAVVSNGPCLIESNLIGQELEVLSSDPLYARALAQAGKLAILVGK